MALYDWGDVRIGRTRYRETWSVAEAMGRTLDLQGQEACPPNPRDDVIAQHDNLLALEAGVVQPLVFTDKPERDCYAMVTKATATMDDWNGEDGRVTSTWTASFNRCGTGNETDLQSRLTGTHRANDFALTGESTHAPPPGHYAYFTGATVPSRMTRTGEDGAVTVYRGLTAGVFPKWGCDPAAYGAARARVEDTSGSAVHEMEGTDRRLPAGAWRIGNGLVRAVPGAALGTLDVQAYTGGAWRSKGWNINIGTTLLGTPDAATIVHNTMEYAVLRLTWRLSPVGRVTLDIAVRRGSRVLELYAQTGVAATVEFVRSTAEAGTAGTGYVAATADDADTNRFVVGSAHTFTAEAVAGGIKTAAVTAADAFIGVAAGGAGAVSGDAPADLVAQYIGALPEAVYAVRR